MDYETQRRLMCELGRRLWQRGWVAANDGNFSRRLGEGLFLVTPAGVSKGFLTTDMLLVVDSQGRMTGPSSYRPSSETALHLACYRVRPDVGGICHAHPPAATAFAAAGIPLDRPVLQEAVVQLGTVPVAPFALPGSQGVADSVAPYCRDYRALLLEYHGAVTWGETMERAYFRLECLEQMANVTLHLKTLGCDRVMPESLVKELEGLRPAWGIR